MSKILPEFIPDFKISIPACIRSCNVYRFSICFKGALFTNHLRKIYVISFIGLILKDNMCKVFMDIEIREQL